MKTSLDKKSKGEYLMSWQGFIILNLLGIGSAIYLLLR